MESAVIGLFGALLGALLAFFASALGTFAKSKDTRLDVRTRVITNERAQWRRDMRELSATFVAVSNRLAVSPEQSDSFELERTRVLLRLRLNPRPDHSLDAHLLRLLPKISKSAAAGNLSDLKADLERFETDMQALIKREWDKSKDEAATGDIAVSDKSAPELPFKPR